MKMKIVFLRLAVLVLTSGLTTTAVTSSAQPAYPSKSIRMILGVSPGGATDFLARTVGTQLAQNIGQKVIIDNRPGANHIIGGELTANAPRDGYTLQLVPEGWVINASVYAKLPFDPLRDFSPIALLAAVPNVLCVHPSIPARTLKSFVTFARAHRGELSYGSSGVGAPSHMAGQLFKVVTGIEYVHVAYRGQGPAVIDLIGGHLQLAFPSIPASRAHILSGKLRALGVTTRQRASALPDVPTIHEAGVPGYEVNGWYGVIGPAGIPQSVVARLNREFNVVLNTPEIRKKMTNGGAEPRTGTPEEFGKAMASDLKKWAKVVASAGIKIK